MEFKHFSHPHGLCFHQAPQGPETTCSGCNSRAQPGTSLYLCRQCKFFLHEQCFHASRSMNHPSHPPHPLTLVPYPTYHSGSFFCDSCSLTGTGFSYTCSACEFDLHIHCAYMPLTTTSHDPYPSFPNPNCPQDSPNSFGPEFDYQLQSSTTCKQYDVNANFPNPQHSFMNELPVPKYNPQMGFGGEEFSSVSNNKPTNSTHAGENRTVPETFSQASVLSGHRPHCSLPNIELPKNSGAQTGLPAEEPSQLNPPQPPITKHFSHQHALQYSKALKEEDDVLCSCCEQPLSGLAYTCTKPTCDFQLHKSCFELPRQLHHKSHPKHALILLPTPPYKEYNGFSCNACYRTGTAFTYHCENCNFDLHIQCATNLPETVKLHSHEHPLNLLYSSPYKNENDQEVVYFCCDLCRGMVDEKCWVYYCQECDYGTDVHCAISLTPILTAREHQQRLEFQMEMNRRNIELMANARKNILSLV